MVGTDSLAVAKGEAGVWKTARRLGGEQLVIYSGPVLRPFTRYYWFARVWDKKEVMREGMSWIETGMMEQKNWNGNWVTDTRDLQVNPAAYFRIGFILEKKVVSARVYVAAAVVVARSQLALAVMMHESAHGVLLSRQWLNDFVGQMFAAGPLFLSLQTYRAGHLKHHLAPMAHDDPVAVVFGIDDYPVSRGRLAARLLADLCGVSYFVSAARMLRGVYRDVLPKVTKSRREQLVEVASMLVSNGLLAGVLALCGHPLLYVGLWLQIGRAHV